MRDFLWSSSFLILGICLIRRITAGTMPMRHRYSLWMMAAIGLCILSFSPWLPKSVFSILNVVNMVQEWTQEGREAQEGEAAYGAAGEGQMQGEISQKELGAGRDVTEKRASLSQAAAWGDLISDLGETGNFVLVGIWMGGALTLAGWMLWVNGRLKRELLKKRAPLERKSSIRPDWEWMTLPIYLVKGLSSPCLLSIKGEKAVYMPEEILENPGELRHGAAHEICHYRQGDIYWNRLRCVLLAVFWFHPLVWLGAWLSRQDCELSCDEAAIKLLGREERFAYGETLLSLVGRRPERGGMLLSGTWMSAGGRQLQRRITWIARGTSMRAISVLGFYFLLQLVFTGTITRPMGTGAEGGELVPSVEYVQDIRALGSGAGSQENREIEVQLARFLAENHLLYVGDAVGSGRIVGACVRAIDYRGGWSTQLQTSQEPYAYRIISQDQDREKLDKEDLGAVSILAFASIENLGSLEVYGGPDGYERGELLFQITRQEAMDLYGSADLTGYGESEEHMLKLVQMVKERL